MLSLVEKIMLDKLLNSGDITKGAYNIRKNGGCAGRVVSENIDIVSKVGKPGIDVIVKPNTKNEMVSVPVVISESGLDDLVYNTFDVGENSDVVIVAGCGIHNCGDKKSQHDGIHQIFVRQNAKMKYIENHYGEGEGTGERILNPKTVVEVFENGVAELDMTQLKGVDSTIRDTEVILHDNAKLIITERLLTDGVQLATSNVIVKLVGENSSAQVISRSVAQGKSQQIFNMSLEGLQKCKGHIQCDSIIMDEAHVASIPKIDAISADAELIHEAAIGRIANDQVVKLMTVGIDEKEAEDIILKGFLS